MSKAALSVFVFGLYVLLLGVLLVLVPNFVIGLFGVEPTTEVWIRVVGMVLFLVGIYYLVAARAELTALFRWTVPVRSSVIFFF